LTLENIEQKDKESSVRRALLFANAAAFLCITKEGCMPSIPSIEEVKEFLTDFKPF